MAGIPVQYTGDFDAAAHGNTLDSFNLKGFRDTAPYVHAHRGRTFVLCLDSAVLEHPGEDTLLQDIAQLQALGIRLVLVFGARCRIDRRLPNSDFHDGCRITRASDMPAVLETVGALQSEIQARLSRGLMNTPMAGMRLRVLTGNLVAARPRGVHDGVDFEHTGEVRRVAANAVENLLQQDAIVLIPPLGYSATGETFNLNAAALACTVAQSISADKLIYLHAEPVLRTRRGLIRQMTSSEALALIRRRKLSPVQRQMLQGAVDATLSSVGRIHLLDARRDGVLLQELFTRTGAGVMVTRTEAYAPRQAEIADVGGIMGLLNPLVAQGVLAERTREELELRIHNFRVIELDGLITACACLHPLSETHAELICLAVHPEYQGQGFGHALLDDAETRAFENGFRQVYVLTTRAMHWFREQGFRTSSPRSLPVARRKFYNNQRNARVLAKVLEDRHG